MAERAFTLEQLHQPRSLQVATEVEPRISRADENAISDAIRARADEAKAAARAEQLARSGEIANEISARIVSDLKALQKLPQPNRSTRQRVDRALRIMEGY